MLGDFLDERLIADLEAVDLVGVAVVGDHRGNGGEQADGGGDQRLGDAGRDIGQGGLATLPRPRRRS